MNINTFLLVLLVIASITFIVWLIYRLVHDRRLFELKSRLAALESSRKELEKKEQDWEEKVKYDKSVIEYLAYEKAKGFPWLAKAYDDYYKLKTQDCQTTFKYKPHPAQKSAEAVRQISKERREAEKAARKQNTS